MKNLLRAALAALCLLSAGKADAAELWDPHLRGVNEGLASGALPPKGVYGVLNNYLAIYKSYDHKGKAVPGTGLTALVEVPILLWVPGIKILGADYGVAIAQPFDYTNYSPLRNSTSSSNGNWGTFNTILVPAILSWSLPNDFHVSAALNVYVDNASSTMSDLNKGKLRNGGLPSGNGFWTFEPSVAVSWLHDGWNLTAHMHLSFNTRSTSTKYHTGTQFTADYTATKTIGKWTFGLGAYQLNQLEDDSGPGAAACKTRRGCRAESYGIGPLVGYQFGGINIMAQYNRHIYTQNDVAGNIFNLRFIVPFN